MNHEPKLVEFIFYSNCQIRTIKKVNSLFDKRFKKLDKLKIYWILFTSCLEFFKKRLLNLFD